MKRSRFVTVSLAGGGALLFGFSSPAFASPPFTPNVWLSLAPSGITTVTIPMAELGQGVGTALAMLIVDELDGDWSRVVVSMANANGEKYGDQGIGGSRSMRKQSGPFRQAGATARAMLVSAASQKWSVPSAECRAEKGAVYHIPTSRRLAYTDLLEAASRAVVDDSVPLKGRSEFRIIGKRLPLLEARAKSTGAAKYGIDAHTPGTLYASIEHAPRLGAALLSDDRDSVLRMPGVRAVVPLLEPAFPNVFPFRAGIAVLAESYWAAYKARRHLRASWSDGPFIQTSTASIRTDLERGLEHPGSVGLATGNVGAGFSSAAKSIEAVYENPLQAHATLEPQNATANVRAAGCVVWASTQDPVAIQRAAAAITGLPVEQIAVHQMLCGGGFGRRSDIEPAVEAIALSKAVGHPVKVVWTREDDTRNDTYRPTNLSSLRGALDADGRLSALTFHYCGLSIGVQRGYNKRSEADAEALEGLLENQIYDIPATRISFQPIDAMPVDLGWWRAVSVAQNLFALESFVDEAAHISGRDPYEYRRSLIHSNTRALRVLDAVAEASNWKHPPAKGQARGIAIAPYGKTIVAQVAEVALRGGNLSVSRIACVVDCGMPVNPSTIEAQMQGGIIWGLGATLKHHITVERGSVREANFDTYPMLRMGDIPEITVQVLDSDEDPSSVGEAAVPAAAPAIANAAFALTGRRLRSLPLTLA
jgi:isoquinoline 1-oxidoreductase subunit beta